MTSYVSDSEQEETDYIDSSRISPNKLVGALIGLEAKQRKLILPQLHQYKQLLSEDQWNAFRTDESINVRNFPFENRPTNRLNGRTTSSTNQILQQSTTPTMSKEDVNVAQTSSSMARTNGEVTALNNNDIPINDEPFDANISSRQLNEEDNNNLKRYFDYNTVPHRRGLRQRNFASTHPYLVDSIKYLGLTSVSYLNDIYSENQDIEPILKLLNHSYLKLKKKYPKDEKYKSKNFYTVLGETKRLSSNDIQIEPDAQYQPELDANLTSSQMVASQNIEANPESDYESDDSIFTPRRKHHTLIEDEQSDEERQDAQQDDYSGSESNTEIISDSEILVRVGGKYLKEHSVLHGTLPESAKRLPFYKNSYQPAKRRTQKPNTIITENRKGLARKKVRTPRARSKETFDDLIDDNPQNMEEYVYAKDSEPLSPLETFGILSEVSESDSEVDELLDLSRDNFTLLQNEKSPESNSFLAKMEEEGPLDGASDYSSDGYGSVIEIDSIDRMLSNTNTKRSANLKRKMTNRNTSKPSSVKRRIVTSKPRNNNYSLPSILQKMKIASRNHSRKRHISKYGNLKRKVIHKPEKPRTPSIKTVTKTASKSNTPHNMNILNTKEIMKSSYVFLRNPIQSSIQFEVESDKYMKKSSSKSFRTFNQIPLHARFPSNYILSKIDIAKIKSLQEGKSYVLAQDSVAVNLLGHTFTLSTVDRFESNLRAEKLFLLLIKLLKDISRLDSESIYLEIYTAIGSLLQWFLILQQPAPDRIWKLLKIAINILSGNGSNISPRYVQFYPYLVLLNFVLVTIHKMNSSEGKSQILDDLYDQNCGKYWPLFFEYFDFQNIESIVGTISYESESFYVMHQLLTMENKLWSLINSTIPQINKDYEILLEDMVSLVTVTPPKCYNWSCFYTIYNGLGNQEDSLVHNRFLDAIELLNQRFGWPIEERMIMLLYNTVTSKKFSNFRDEWADPDLIGIIRSRNDFPDTSFFERFLKVLYGYISDLQPGTDKKRLSTKLFTSSQYKYEPSREHFVMFVNRMNYILFQSQIFKEDMKNQFLKLIESVVGLNDENILDISIRALCLYSQIANDRKYTLPTESFALLMNELFSSYRNISKFKSFWNLVLRALYHLESLEAVFEIFLKLSDIPDKFSLDVFELILDALDKYSSTETSKKVFLINQLEMKVHNILHRHMSRDTSSKIQLSTNSIIELEIKVWVKATFNSPDSKWEKLVLQKFPYIGNSELREKYILYFYREILNFTRLESCKDHIIISILRNLSSTSTSSYLPDILNKLNASKDGIIQFQKRWIPEMMITLLNISDLRDNIVSNILENISNDTQSHHASKRIYIEEMLKALNLEFDKNFLVMWFRDFCRRTLMELQKYCLNYVSNSELFHSLANKLGILKEELDELSWHLKPLKQKLSDLHSNLTNALVFNNDHSKVLRIFTNSNMELFYQLVSIYLKAIYLGQCEKWKNLFYLLDFFSKQLESYKFAVDILDFPKYLNMLVQVPLISDKKCSRSDVFYRLKTIYSILKILSYLFILFDGYKDIVLIREGSTKFLKAYFDASITPLVDFDYTTLRPFEIFQSVREANLNIEEITDLNSMNKIKDALGSSLEQLEHSCTLQPAAIECLSLDFDFY